MAWKISADVRRDASDPTRAVGVTGGHSIVLVRTPYQNLDYGGYAMLARYADDPLVQASAYVYMLTTTLALPGFVEEMTKFRDWDWSGAQYHSVRVPSSNTGVFSREVLTRYGTNFEPLITKHQAIELEPCLHLSYNDTRNKALTHRGRAGQRGCLWRMDGQGGAAASQGRGACPLGRPGAAAVKSTAALSLRIV